MNEKKVFEAEVLDSGEEKNNVFFKDKTNNIEEQINSMKKAILLKGISVILLPLMIFILIISGIVSLIMLLFDRPFDYIFAGIFLFIILSPIYKLIKMFKK